MAAKKILFCLRANQSNKPLSKGTFLLYFVHAKESSESNSIKRKEYFFGRHDLCNRSMPCFFFTWVIPGIIQTFTYSLWPAKVVTPRNSMTQ